MPLADFRAAGADLRQLGQAEVQDLRLPALGDEDVRGLDVAVDDALRVRGVEGVCNLDREIERDFERQRPVVDPVLQRLAVEELHRDERLALGLVDVVHRADVRVVERRGRARFALEALERTGLARQFVGQELQGDRAIEPHVLGLVDDAHAATAEAFRDLVMGDPLTDHVGRQVDRSLCLRSRSTRTGASGA